jgi:hypothetical protein
VHLCETVHEMARWNLLARVRAVVDTVMNFYVPEKTENF